MKNYRLFVVSALVAATVCAQTVPETFEEMVPMPDGVKAFDHRGQDAP